MKPKFGDTAVLYDVHVGAEWVVLGVVENTFVARDLVIGAAEFGTTLRCTEGQIIVMCLLPDNDGGIETGYVCIATPDTMYTNKED